MIDRAKLRCPACGEYLSRVVDSRVAGDPAAPVIRRRRQCLTCRSRYATVERVTTPAGQGRVPGLIPAHVRREGRGAGMAS